LLEGIQIRSQTDVSVDESVVAFDGLDVLYAVTKSDAWSFGVSDVIDLSVLCAATEQDYFDYLNWVDPMIELKSRFNLHNYKYKNSQLQCRKFISAQMKRIKKLNEMTGEKCLPPPDFESLDEVVKRIKNTDIMSQLEVELRSKLAQLQDIYRDKQREITRLKSSPKKTSQKSRLRGPGRPKKRCLKISAKTKMGRPRKRLESEEANGDTSDDSDNNGHNEDEANLSPPVLQPWSQTYKNFPFFSWLTKKQIKLLRLSHLTAFLRSLQFLQLRR
jgi:hypothetical protein